MKYPQIAIQLISMKDKDLSLRQELIHDPDFINGYHPMMAVLHDRHKLYLEQIISEIGYPTIDKVGEEGYQAAWLIIQHAINHPDFMRSCATLLKQEVGKGKAHAVHLAYLTDRILVFENKPQLYGTAYDWNEKGELLPNPYDQLEKVNKRRKQIGLLPLEEHTKNIQNNALKNKEQPPSNYYKKKRAYEIWCKEVGWRS